jgi:acyl-homoserine lactone acylase PvdQ
MPWGLSDDPASPHYTDQTEELFSKSIFKPTYFNKNDLMKNLESTEELIITESD